MNVGHESSAAIAAAYYGLMKRSSGLAMSIRGVGAANMVVRVANVDFERMPLVAVCECAVPSAVESESVQQYDQQLFGGVVEYQAILTPQGAGEMIREPFARALDGRRSASILHLPAGVSKLSDDGLSTYKVASAPSSINETALKQVKELSQRAVARLFWSVRM